MGTGGVRHDRLIDEPGRSATVEYRRARRAARWWRVASLVCGGTAAVALIIGGWQGLSWLLVLAAGVALVGWAVRPDPDVDRWRRGAEGEVATAALLDRLPRRYVVLHDRRVPRSRANIDHLVIGPTGVWVIDTKTRLGRGRHPVEVGAVTFEAACVSSVLDVDAVPLVAVHGSDLRRRGRVVQGVRVVPAERVVRRVRRGGRLFDRSQVAELADRAEEVLRPA